MQNPGPSSVPGTAVDAAGHRAQLSSNALEQPDHTHNQVASSPRDDLLVRMSLVRTLYETQSSVVFQIGTHRGRCRCTVLEETVQVAAENTTLRAQVEELQAHAHAADYAALLEAAQQENLELQEELQHAQELSSSLASALKEAQTAGSQLQQANAALLEQLADLGVQGNLPPGLTQHDMVRPSHAKAESVAHSTFAAGTQRT